MYWQSMIIANTLLVITQKKNMNDNIIAYILSLVCIILVLIEWRVGSHKKAMTNTIVFVVYSFPLYYLMLYKGSGGAAFTWWFYLVLSTSIHVIILLLKMLRFFLKRYFER